MIDTITSFSQDAQEFLENLKRQGIYARIERIDAGSGEELFDEYGDPVHQGVGDLVVSFRLHYGTYPGENDTPDAIRAHHAKVNKKDLDAFEAARVLIPDD